MKPHVTCGRPLQSKHCQENDSLGRRGSATRSPLSLPKRCSWSNVGDAGRYLQRTAGLTDQPTFARRSRHDVARSPEASPARREETEQDWCWGTFIPKHAYWLGTADLD